MTTSEIANKVISILKDSGFDATSESHLKNDLHLDSLDKVEFGMAIEQEFSISLTDEDLYKMHTVQDVVEGVSKYRGE